jgi:2-dehydro-3-deoxygluconokinase
MFQDPQSSQPRFDVVALGESMLRYSTPIGNRLQSARQFDVHVGGTESNVLAALARMERNVAWVSSLPRNPLGLLLADVLRTSGIDLSLVDWQDEGRVGVFYVEYGQGPLAMSVTYDRADSCISHMPIEAVDWERALQTRILHLTGITPALTPISRTLTQHATDRARDTGIPFSFDVNYRSKLWSESEARDVLPQIAHGAEILCCAVRDARSIWGDPGRY